MKPVVEKRFSAPGRPAVVALLWAAVVAVSVWGVSARAAAEEFVARFRRHEVPSDVKKVSVPARDGEGGRWICQLLTDQGLTKSNNEARRLIRQGGVRVDGEKVSDADLHLEEGTHLIQVGKRRFLEVTIGG